MSFSIRHSNDVEDIIDITWRQARSKTEVLIFEIGKMDDLMPLAQAEEIRQAIKDNKIRIRQLSKYERINKYTDVKDYEQLIQLRHIDEDIFKVSSEIVIFEDTVAIYRTKPSVTYLEINDSGYADMMRSLFESVWKVSDVMVLGMGGSEEAKQYKPISTKLKVGRKLIPAVIYPAKDDGVIEKAFKRIDKGGIEKYLQECATKWSAHVNWLENELPVQQKCSEVGQRVFRLLASTPNAVLLENPGRYNDDNILQPSPFGRLPSTH